MSFDRAVVERATVRFRYRLPLRQGARFHHGAGSDDRQDHDRGRRGRPGESRAWSSIRRLSFSRTPPGWIRAADDLRSEPAGERPVLQFVEKDQPKPARPFAFKARALAQVALPPPGDSAAADQDGRRDWTGRDARLRGTGSSCTVPSFRSSFPRGSSGSKLASTVESPIKWIMISRRRGIVCGFPGDSGSKTGAGRAGISGDGAEAGRELAASEAARRRGGSAGSLGGSSALEPGRRWNSCGAGRTRIIGPGAVFPGNGGPGRDSAGLNEWLVGAVARHRPSTISPDRAADGGSLSLQPARRACGV